MYPPHSCNLAAMLSYPGDLDWSLCMTREWEKRTPFYSYVRLDPAAYSISGQTSLFPGFSKLPAELQIRVLSYCPARTLFQVMRVSSMLRVEAAKFFWANPDAWFVADVQWLYQYGGYPGHTFWDATFMNHVQQVELQYGIHMDRSLRQFKIKAMTCHQDPTAEFWHNLRRRFPNARKVTINQSWEKVPTQDSPGPVAWLLGELVDSCPAAINISVLVLERNPLHVDKNDISPAKRWQRTLYRRTIEGGWLESQSEHNRATLLMPAKQFNGPIGEFKKVEYKDYMIELRRDALVPLLIEALARLHFTNGSGDPVPCPFPDCGIDLARAEEWIAHAVDQHTADWGLEGVSWYSRDISMYHDKTDPSYELKDTFMFQEKNLGWSQGVVNCLYTDLENDWRDAGDEGQKDIERQWTKQLETDPSWDTEEKDMTSKLWTDYKEIVTRSDGIIRDGLRY
jgi:hypothetical protein